MTNLTISNALTNVPAHLLSRINSKDMSPLAAQVSSGLGSNSVPRISIKGGRFRLMVGDAEVLVNTPTLDVIIVGANAGLSKLWYSKKWTADTDDYTAPDCFSHDGITPNFNSSNVQNKSCASCPHNAWGSKVSESGQESKACADQKRLAVVASNDPGGDVYLLQVTPSALKGLNQYQRELHTHGIPAEIIRTQIGFDSTASFPKLTFGFGGYIDEKSQATVDKLFDSDDVKCIIGESDSPVVRVEVPMIAPVVEPVAEPEVQSTNAFDAPPVKTKAIKKRAAKKKPVQEEILQTTPAVAVVPEAVETVPDSGITEDASEELLDSIRNLLGQPADDEDDGEEDE